MSAQHTPGPWDVTPSPGGYRRKPCFVIRSTTKPGRTRVARVDNEHDASLIAAAPGLLETARRALAAMVRTTAPDNEFTDALDALDAAIAKAQPITGDRS